MRTAYGLHKGTEVCSAMAPSAGVTPDPLVSGRPIDSWASKAGLELGRSLRARINEKRTMLGLGRIMNFGWRAGQEDLLVVALEAEHRDKNKGGRTARSVGYHYTHIVQRVGDSGS